MTRRSIYTAPGFTLLELLLVVSISVIMVAVTVPNIIATVDGYRLNTSARMIAGRLLETRINAIKRSRAAQLTIDRDARDVRIETTDDAGNVVQIGARAQVAAGVRFVAQATPDQVAFNASGRPTGVDGTGVQIQLTATAGRVNRVVTVTMTNTGNIRVR